MALEDTLKEIKNEITEKSIAANAKRKIQEAEDKERFDTDYKICFDEVIYPAVDKLMMLFKKYDFKMVIGQRLEKIVYSSLKQLSVSGGFNSFKMQIDIYADNRLKRICLSTHITGRKVPPMESNFLLSDVTNKSLEDYFDKSVSKYLRQTLPK